MLLFHFWIGVTAGSRREVLKALVAIKVQVEQPSKNFRRPTFAHLIFWYCSISISEPVTPRRRNVEVAVQEVFGHDHNLGGTTVLSEVEITNGKEIYFCSSSVVS